MTYTVLAYGDTLTVTREELHAGSSPIGGAAMGMKLLDLHRWAQDQQRRFFDAELSELRDPFKIGARL